MKIFIKTLLFVFVTLITNPKVVLSANVAFLDIQETTTSLSFHKETPKTVFIVIENDWVNRCQNEQDFVAYRSQGAGVADDAAKGGLNTVTKSESVLGHIFRDAAGHVNPSTVASQNRYISLFEKVANNSGNLNPNVLTNFQRTASGFQGYSQIFRNGQQVWTQTLNGKIINAGINIIPK